MAMVVEDRLRCGAFVIESAGDVAREKKVIVEE